MMAEVSRLLAAAPAAAGRDVYQGLVLEENVLGKRSASNRVQSLQRLSELFALDPGVAVFRIMRGFWDSCVEERGVLALMCGCARDPLLRASAGVVLDAKPGMRLSTEMLASTVERPMSRLSREAIGQRLGSSWVQAGYLRGRVTRARVHPVVGPGAAAFALALGFMEGGRGSLLLGTFWVRLLDSPPEVVLELVQSAARHGWIEFRSAGDIMDLRVDALFTDEERRWCHAQQD